MIERSRTNETRQQKTQIQKPISAARALSKDSNWSKHQVEHRFLNMNCPNEYFLFHVRFVSLFLPNSGNLLWRCIQAVWVGGENSHGFNCYTCQRFCRQPLLVPVVKSKKGKQIHVQGFGSGWHAFVQACDRQVDDRRRRYFPGLIKEPQQVNQTLSCALDAEYLA